MRLKNLSRALLLLMVAACSNAGSDAIFPSLYQGSLNVGFYLDRDDNGTRSTDDPVIPGVRVVLFSAGGKDTIQTLVSDSTGRVQFTNLPFGTYHFSIDSKTIGDSLIIGSGDSSKVRILARLDSLTDLRDFGLKFPEMTVAQARSSAPGKRVIIRGKVLASYTSFLVPQGFVADTSGAIRVTNAKQITGATASAIGDSVLVVGTTGTDLGQAALLNGVFTTLGTSTMPIPKVISVADARSAKGGTLDAALVQINSGKIVDTSIVIPNYRVLVADPATPTDQVETIIDQLVDVVHSSFKLGFPIVVKGVLVPKGDGTWVIRPRMTADVTFP